MLSSASEVGVVGAGIVGLATAFELVRQGLAVTVYEAGVPGQGQSAGQSRIFRHAHTDPRLVDYAVRARGVWREWEDVFGQQFIAPDGALALGESVHQQLELLAGRDAIDARPASSADLAERLPVLAEYAGPAMLDSTGGSIATQQAMRAVSERLGDRIVADQVLSLRQVGPQDVEVRTGSGLRHHDAVVICAGRGTQALARGAGLSLPIATGAHVRATFRPRSPVTSLATLQDTSGVFGAAGVYAAAYPDRSGYGVGLAADVPVAEDGSMLASDELAGHLRQIIAYVRTALPGLDPEPVGYVHCWVTRLPWSDDGVAIWQVDDLAFVAGHNLFKHAPALGQDLVATVIRGQAPEPLSPRSRLGETPSS